MPRRASKSRNPELRWSTLTAFTASRIDRLPPARSALPNVPAEDLVETDPCLLVIWQPREVASVLVLGIGHRGGDSIEQKQTQNQVFQARAGTQCGVAG
jgi:hypothetical protein